MRSLDETIKHDGGFISNKARRITKGTQAERIVHDLADEFDRLYCKYDELASLFAQQTQALLELKRTPAPPSLAEAEQIIQESGMDFGKFSERLDKDIAACKEKSQ